MPEQLPNALDRAFRTALTRRAPTAIIIPSDLQTEDYSPPEHAFKQVPSSAPGLVAPTVRARPRPRSPGPRRCSTPGSKVAILVGQGARGAAAEVEQVADVLGAGVAKALLGKDVLSDELPFVTGVDRAAGHPAQLRADERLRHAADRRLELPVHASSCPSSARPGRCRSTSTAR